MNHHGTYLPAKRQSSRFASFPLVKSDLIETYQLVYVSDWIGNVAQIFIKLSFFILYWNIFKPFRWLKLGIIIGGIVVTAGYAAFVLASIIAATPGGGSTWLDKDYCRVCVKSVLPLGVWGLASDIYILVLPISGIFRLQLALKRKVGLLMVFMTGIG